MGSNLDVSGNQTVRGNLVVSGNITNAALTALNLQMQNTVMDAESVYYFFGTDALNVYQPIMEVSKDINCPIYTDTSNTVISQEFINQTQSILPSSGKIMYYPNGAGTPQFPIDGTAGTPISSAISSNIGTPSFVDVTDASGVYGVALKDVYKRSPVVKDASGNNVGGVKSVLHYTSYADLDGPFTEQAYTVATKESLDYLSSRGYGHRAPQYVPTDSSGNIIEKNLFVNNFGTDGYQAIEFVYPTPTSVVPLSMFLTFYRSPLNTYGSKYMADKINLIRTPVNIPITTNAVTFGQAVIDGSNSVLYDISKKQITINFVVPNTWTGTWNVTNFGWTQTITQTMTSFKGSYAIVKRSQQTFVNNGETASVFVSCSPADPNSFMVQISPTVTFTESTLAVIDGVTQASPANGTSGIITRSLTDSVSGNFQGFTLTRPGFGNTGSQINGFVNRVSALAGASIDEIAPLPGGIQWGDNPYTSYYEYLIQRGRSSEWSNKGWISGSIYLNFNTLATTPETISSVLPSNYAKGETDITNMNTLVILHEAYHHSQYSMGNVRVGNTEAEATAIEQDAPLYLSGSSLNPLRAVTAFPGYMYALHRGYQVLTKNSGTAASINNQYTLARVGYGTSTIAIPHGFNSMYGEAMFYSYVALAYDKTQQVLRRKNEITNVLVNKVLYDNGFIETNNIYYNGQIGKWIYAQALKDLTNLDLVNVYSDFAISSLFLRNNTAIPEKYRTLLPVWIFGENNSMSSTIAPWLSSGNGFNDIPIKKYTFWSDIDRSLPIAYDNYGYRSTNTTYGPSDTQTLIPFWPRDASGNNKWKMGTWTRDSSGYQTSFAYNNTTPYVASRTVVLEDMAMNSYILPVSGATDLGVSSVMSSISIEVKRGRWDFTVVQFVPDGSGGVWTQLPSRGNVEQVDNPGTWDDASGEVFDGLQTSYIDASGSQTVTFDLSGFSVQSYNGFKYYPKLVCVNRGLDDYGMYKNIYPVQARYSGKIIITPTFV
jgi:hypothetical protein